VLLDLVKKALPRGSFIVVFGDTGMEFPDTYDVVKKTEEQCREEGIPFHTARSHLEPEESWRLFGPPSRVLRWCCSVHKSAPQVLKLREVTGKSDYRGLAFVGVRKWESSARAGYEDFNDGKKTRGQYSHHSILQWTSAEVWLYTFARGVALNGAYQKGSARVGCICCPMGGNKARYIEHINYACILGKYIRLIEAFSIERNIDGDYIKNDGWAARKSGRDLASNPNHYSESVEKGVLTIKIDAPASDWQAWINTIDVKTDKYSLEDTKSGYTIKLKEELFRQDPLLGRLFRQVFHKAAYCKGCKICEANCINGAMRFVGNGIRIHNCAKCQECHEIEYGCWLYHSLRHPKGDGSPMKKSLDTMSNHAPKVEWLGAFFTQKNSFFTEHSLGPKQFQYFTRVLRDADLAEKKQITPFGELIASIGWDSDAAQGLILLNLAYKNPQVEWYVANFDIGLTYPWKEAKKKLTAVEVKPEVANSICYAFRRLTETPLGTVLRFGHVTADGCLVRTKCSVTDLRVLLYGLYKFAEKCGDHKEFTLSALLSDDIERDGISPTRIFGLTREDARPMLEGLSAKYSGFINASFTLGLDRITLARDKSSQDVLDLFR
jgi:phosphoadenosine phosphosulfate reductase